MLLLWLPVGPLEKLVQHQKMRPVSKLLHNCSNYIVSSRVKSLMAAVQDTWKGIIELVPWVKKKGLGLA